MWQQAHREQVAKSRRKLTREERIDQQLLHAFGVGLFEIRLLIQDQGGVCTICLLPIEDPASGLWRCHTDHDHVTLVVRGVLHAGCNQALGMLREDPDSFERAAAYLRHHALEAE